MLEDYSAQQRPTLMWNPARSVWEILGTESLLCEHLEFWSIYPKKTDKAQAKRMFNRALNRVRFEDILAGVIKFANDPNLPTEKRFIKNPATWLNADSWENGPLPEDPRKANRRDYDEQERIRKEWGNL